jgi:tripartite-type tricarboxylate transporter receptor subunit TctC
MKKQLKHLEMVSFLVFALCFVLGGIYGGLKADIASAAEYPNKPLTYMVFFPPGGKSDLTARLVAPYLQKYLGTPVVVANQPGGAGVIGHKMIREEKPDGYTLAHSGATITAQYAKPGISMKDYTWIARIYLTPYVIAVPSNSPFKSLKELVDFAKANPSKLKHGNSSTGNTPHLASASFESDAGIQYTQVAYKGEGPSIVGLASGEVDLVFGTLVAVQQMIEAGKVKLLAVCGSKRMPGKHANIPTCKEAGYDFEWETWEAVFGPKGLQNNKAVWPKLSEAIRKTVLDPEFGQKLEAIGFDASYSTGENLEKWMNRLDQKTKKVIYQLGLQYDK